ncbi:hypothetical protein Holit_00443 [Hollandina sp. SP2]
MAYLCQQHDKASFLLELFLIYLLIDSVYYKMMEYVQSVPAKQGCILLR